MIIPLIEGVLIFQAALVTQCLTVMEVPSSVSLQLVRAELQLHLCKECDQTFSQASSLKSHIKVHTGEKFHPCKQCDKTFSNSGSLNSHIKIHTGEKPFSCNQCNKTFSQSGSLKNHIKIHTGEKPFPCNQCNKTFSQSGSLYLLVEYIVTLVITMHIGKIS